ncbi:MAG TPA: hypothetical protein VK478_06180 [Gemmatimonadaceae bacterium]|jgi:hypothetical protein|nr:hypothetical protein [Gemmatimonadaceae bacterium]
MMPQNAQKHVSVTALRHSFVVLGAVALIALVGLSVAHNWPKLLRVGLAAASYAAVLLIGSRLRSSNHPDAVVPYWLFAIAGATAGLVSGIVRPTILWPVALVSIVAGAFLLSTVHWAGTRRYTALLASGIL